MLAVNAGTAAAAACLLLALRTVTGRCDRFDVTALASCAVATGVLTAVSCSTFMHRNLADPHFLALLYLVGEPLYAAGTGYALSRPAMTRKQTVAGMSSIRDSKIGIGVPEAHRSAPVAPHNAGRRMLAAIGLPACLVLACHSEHDPPGNNLSEELKARNLNEGLAIVRPRTNWFAIARFGSGPYSIRNPRDFSSAWISQNDGFVAWNNHALPDVRAVACLDAITVETPGGGLVWQVPGSTTNIRAMAVSPDGRRIAFDGTYAPAAVADSRDPDKPRNLTSGVHYADVHSGRVVRVFQRSQAPDSSAGIGWSPRSNAFAFANQNRIYIHDLSTGVSKTIGEGQNPTWSPDGKSIAFRSTDGWATVINPATFVSRRLLSRHRILDAAVQWSPDSQYVLVAEPLGFISNLLSGQSLFSPLRRGWWSID
jgi:hypothetical protein